jgi:hypothetical protein
MATLLQRRTDPEPAGDEASAAAARSQGWLAVGLLVIASGLATVALLGPLASGVIDYRVTETLRNQTIGLDLVSLLAVAPLCVLAALLARRDHPAGPPLALGIGAYTSYMFVQYILGPDYADLPGNNERLFPLFLLLFAAGWIVALAAWHASEAEPVAPSARRERLIGRVVLPVLAFLAFFRYLPALADWMSATREDEGYLAGPSFAWAIAMLDLGVFLPATVATCVGLVRGRSWARKALHLVVGWFGLVGLAVAAMALATYVNDDPNASGGNAVFMTALGLAFAALAFWVFRPLFSPRPVAKLPGR